eukprot:4534205-Heterocapsa_arctica.AAC.1
MASPALASSNRARDSALRACQFLAFAGCLLILGAPLPSCVGSKAPGSAQARIASQAGHHWLALAAAAAAHSSRRLVIFRAYLSSCRTFQPTAVGWCHCRPTSRACSSLTFHAREHPSRAPAPRRATLPKPIRHCDHQTRLGDPVQCLPS